MTAAKKGAADKPVSPINTTHELRLSADQIEAQVKDDGPKSVAENLYNATSHLTSAQRKLADMQKQYAPGTAAWHQCESIDDDLHEALTLLGQ